jgi:hypothetical protein
VSERPTPDELAEAIEEFLAGEVLPTLDDHRARFRMLVALNALGIVRRELAKLPPEDDAEQRELAGADQGRQRARRHARARQSRRRGAAADRQP